MITHLIKFSVCLFVFWLIYMLLLERQKMHQFKRFYLLGSIIVAFIIPLLSITYYVEPIIQDFEAAPIYFPIESSFIETPIEEAPLISLETILWSIYGIGTLLFSIRFVINLIKLYQTIAKGEKIGKQSFIYVLLKEYRIPHSFFKYIFLNKQRFDNKDIPKEVLLHEQTHAKQLHSLDIIAIELLQIILWFHPLLYILKHHVKLNHEFLADQAVLNKGTEAKTYQNILLQFSSSTQDYKLSSAINYSSFKKRFTVMKTQTSKTRVWLSTLLLLPIIAILFFSFAEKEYVEKDNSEILEAISNELEVADKLNLIYVNKASEAQMIEYRNFISEYNKTKTINGDQYERAIIIYDQLMSPKQRASVDKYPDRLIPEINLSKTKPIKPSSEQFEDFKNSEKYAIWIDGKHVPNKILNNYSAEDFIHVIGSFVHKNARSKKFPQANQYNLYTKAGFKFTYQDSQLHRYKKATQQYSNAITQYLKGYRKDNSELKLLKAQADKIYKQFTDEALENHNILPPPPVPATKQNSSTNSKSKDPKGGPNATYSEDAYNQQFSNTEYTAYNGNTNYARSIEVEILNNSSYLIDGIKATKKTFINVFNKLHQDITPEVRNKIVNIHVSSSKEISNQELWFIYNSLKDYGFHRIVAPNQEINRSKGNTPVVIENGSSKQEKASVEQIAEYNKLAKYYNAMIKNGGNILIKMKDMERLKYIYNLMSYEQRKNAKPFPDFPEPPPVPHAPDIIEVIEEEEIPAPPTPPSIEKKYLVKERPVSESATYEDEIEIVEVRGIPEPPPPPEPISPLDYIIEMAKSNAKFFYEGKSISSDKAIELIKKNRKLNINSQNTDKKQALIYISKKPILIGKKGDSPAIYINGKKLVKSKKAHGYTIALTKKEVKRLKLTLAKGEVASFKIKLRGIRTDAIEGNSISKTTIDNLINYKEKLVTLFDIKDDEGNRLKPVIIDLIDNLDLKNLKTIDKDIKKTFPSKKTGSIDIETGTIKINGVNHFYSKRNGIVTYFNRFGEVVDRNGKIAPISKGSAPTFYYNQKKISPNRALSLLENNRSISVISKTYKNGSYDLLLADQTNFNTNTNINKNHNINPNSVVDLSEVIAQNAEFYLNDLKITTERALETVRTNSDLRVSTIKNEGETPKVYLWNN